MEKGFQLNIAKVEKIVESKETEDLEACLKTLESCAVSIGEGDSSTVFVAEGTPFSGVCLKKIKERPKMLCNDLATEHEYQITAREAGVRTPLPLFSLETEGGAKYLGMERIEGVSVLDVKKRPSLMPKTFKYDVFFKALEEEVRKMHQVGIHHRSLHGGNIMIEAETGLPVILDFGTATTGSGSDFTYEEGVMVLNPKTGRYEFRNGQFEDDNKMVQSIRTILKPFLLLAN